MLVWDKAEKPQAVWMINSAVAAAPTTKILVLLMDSASVG